MKIESYSGPLHTILYKTVMLLLYIVTHIRMLLCFALVILGHADVSSRLFTGPLAVLTFLWQENKLEICVAVLFPEFRFPAKKIQSR